MIWTRAVVLLVLLSLGILPAAHATEVPGAEVGSSAVDTVTMVGEPRNYILSGGNHLYRSDRDVVELSGSVDTGAKVRVESATSGGYFNFYLAAPRGESLTVGGYPGAQRTSFRGGGAPGMDISGSGRGCNKTSGQFTVIDVDDELTRLWLVYEMYCDGGSALFGEIRINVDDDDRDAALVVAPTRVDWPTEYPGASGRPVGVRLFNVSDEVIAVESASVVEGDADFRLEHNACGEVGPGDSCAAYVAFEPSAVGPRSGLLRLTDTTGATHDIALTGSGRAGETSWDMVSDGGDFIGDGKTYAYRAVNSTIEASGDEERVRVRVGSTWIARFGSGPGALLLPGRTFVTNDGVSDTDGPQIDLSGKGRACNMTTGRFTVREAAYDDMGRVEAFSITFTQHCEGATPALRGSIAWSAADEAFPVPTKDDEQVELTVAARRFATAGSRTPVRLGAVGGTPGETVEVHAQPQGRAERLVGTRRVRADGSVPGIGVIVQRNTRLRAVYAPSGVAQEARDRVRVRVRAIAEVRRTRRGAVLVGRVSPRQSEGCARVQVVRGRGASPKDHSTTRCLEMRGKRVRHAWRIPAGDTRRVRARLVYEGSAWNADGRSRWQRLARTR